MGFFDKLKQGLNKTKNSIDEKINQVFSTFRKVDEEFLDELEEALIMSDIGVDTSTKIISELRGRLKREKIQDEVEVKNALREEIKKIFDELDVSLKLHTTPSVILVVGVNGVGKTTSIGKIANNLAKNEKADILIVDTAGRLHNKKYLMDELNKIQKVINKEMPEADKEVLLVIDGTTGQNAISQVKAFKQETDITGLILTKLDGTAKGGAVIGIVQENKIPVKFIGVGEQIDDMQVFNSDDFVKAIIE